MANCGKAEISLLFKPAASVPLLNVSERTRMSVVPRSSDVFCSSKNSPSGVCKDAHSPNNGIRAKKSKKLPAVLSREETAKIFSLLPENDYGLFLRLLECCSYKVVAVGFHALPTEGVSYLAKIGLIWLLMMCSGVYYERKMEQL